MRVIDLSESYAVSFRKGRDRQAYEAAFPELFDHYYRFWTRREHEIANLADAELRQRKCWIETLISRLKHKLLEQSLDLNDIDLVCMVGVGTTNGHAFRHDGRFCVWLPLETYASEKLVEIFVTHELVHALHYGHNPDFYFSKLDEKNKMSRQLITEGVATYLTRELLGVSPGEALWADYLNADKLEAWTAECRANLGSLVKSIREGFYSSNRNRGLFHAADPDDIYNYRSGYYAGLKLVESLAVKRSLSMKALLELPRRECESEVLQLLRMR